MKPRNIARLALLLLLAAGPSTAARLSVEIQEPAAGAVVPIEGERATVEVVGGASIYGGVKALDLFLVMDSSESLHRTDRRNRRTTGVIALVESLHPRADIHLGVVDFDKKATLLAPLSPDREAAIRALETLDQKGETDIAKGIRTALRGFNERGRPFASKVILLFTDGKSDEREALQAMDEARRAGVAIHSLLLGDVDKGEELLRRIAVGTNGSFVAVREPSRLRDAFLNLRTTGVDRVTLSVNGGPPMRAKLVGGAFTARVALRPGENRIEAVATSLSGETAASQITVHAGGTLRVSIERPEPGAEVVDGKADTLIRGIATTWDPRRGPEPPGFDPGIREVWLYVNEKGPHPAQLAGGRFQAELPLATGENRVLAVATSVDGRTAEDQATITVQPPGCAELRVEALRGDRPAVYLSDRAIAVVFDASNSMWGRMQGEPKISVAKRILGEALDWLPQDLALSLRVYGHRQPHARRDCHDSELLVPLARGDRSAIRSAIGGVKPRGQTPLAYSLEQIAGDLGGFRGERAVVLVTDGIESCGGDPAAAARSLQARGPLPVHVIGFGLARDQDEDSAALRAIAQASGGRFLVASSAEELREALSVTAGTPFAVRRDGRVVAEGALGSEAPLRLPGGEYTLRLESVPPYELPLQLASEQGTLLRLKREGRKVFHARSTAAIPYASCESEPAAAAPGGFEWQELPDADAPPAARRR
jgi:Mg-chelatase subunit ChlD